MDIQQKQLDNADPTDIATLKIRDLIVGRLLHAQVQKSFSDIETAGGTVEWDSMHKGWFETVYFNLKIEGDVELMRAVARYMDQIMSK